MNYEQKYNEALEKARQLCAYPTTKPFISTLQDIFPELKESEDERIVKCLLNYFHHVRYNGLDLKGTNVDEVIAWLEKQRGHNYTWKPSDKQMDALNIAIGEANAADTAAGDKAAEILTSLYEELKKQVED